MIDIRLYSDYLNLIIDSLENNNITVSDQTVKADDYNFLQEFRAMDYKLVNKLIEKLYRLGDIKSIPLNVIYKETINYIKENRGIKIPSLKETVEKSKN